MLYTVIDPQNPSEIKDIIEAPNTNFNSNDISLIEFCGNVLSLINGKLYIWNSEDQKWISLKSNLMDKNIITLKSRFNYLFALTDNGEIYLKDSDSENESDEFNFVELKLTVKQREPCPHGIKFDDQSIFGVTDIDCSLTSVYIIDSEQNLWTYNREKPLIDKNGYIQVTQINFKRKVWNIFCGRSHCVALCEALDSLQNHSTSIFEDSEISLLSPDTSLVTGPVTSTPRRNSINPKCDDCQAESNCRLSLLMKLADESASSNNSTTTPQNSNGNNIHTSDTPTSSTSTTTVTPASASEAKKSVKDNLSSETPKSSMRSKLKFEKLRFPFRNSKQKSPKKDLKARTVWHTASLPLGSSLGSFGSPRRRHESEDGGEVEMSTIGSSSSTLPRQAPPSATITDLTGSAIFSYVNLDNFIEIGESSLSTTPDSHSQRPSISTTSNPSVAASSAESSPIKKPPIKVENPMPKADKFELWSWGTNSQGQLGHGDTIARREPKMIRGVPGLIIKICVGDNHNIALMASGEAYVWGSNSHGQLKQMNQSFIESPTLWRLGAVSTIIDVEVGPNSTAAIVAGQSNKSNASIYHFGRRDDESESETSSTSVLNGVAKLGSPFGFCSISKDFGVLIGILPDKDEEENKSIKENYSKVLTITEAVKVASQLSSISPKLVHSSKDSEAKTLLLNLSEKVKAWSQLLSRLSSNCLKSFSKFGNLNILGEKNCQFKDLCKTLLELHFAFIEAVAFRCFSDIKLDDDLLFQIDKLCLENNTESSQQQKRIKYLFELPFKHFKSLRNIASTAEKLPPNFWKHFDRTLERNEGYARNTYNVAKELQQFNVDSTRPSSISFYLPQGSSIQSLVKPSRLVIWSSHDPSKSLSTPIIKVKETGPTAAPTTTWRRFMSANFTTIVVFSDAIALIQKGDFIIIEMPLVWMNSVSSSINNEMDLIDPALMTEETSELTVQILAPEYEFHVEFPNVEMKNQLLTAFSASFRLHRERTELTVFDDQLGTSIHVLPQTRYGIYDYSSTHYMYKNCRYEGFWKTGIPHGAGTITYFDGREYKGRFINGNIHGFGEMKIPEEQKEPSPLMSSVFFTEFPAKKTNKFHHYKGKWKNGKLHGLSFIQYANGDTYEGYCIAGQPHGHGVYRSMEYNGGQQVYVGAWHGGVKHGYGVLSLNKERYLGMWKDDMRHEKGCQITIDGVFHEGIFDRNRFTKGRIVYQTNENEIPASYEGEFEKIGIAAGKGILRLTPADQIEGIIHGTVLSGELKITNATYTRKDTRPAFHISIADLQIVDEGPVESQWAVIADLKWQELFDQFLLDELGFGEAGKSDEELCKRAWERLSSGVEKIKVQKSISIDERLERVPNVYEEWSPAYYSTVCEFWNLCLSTPHHPINRLINGLVEIFCCSYNNIGTHAIMYDSAVLEFTSLIQRAYRVMRYLFPHLPSVSSMYQSIPLNPITNSTTNIQEDVASVSSLEDKDTTSVKSTSSKKSSGQGSVGPSSTSDSDFTVATPCCDFIIHHFFGQCYAELFTMYSVKCNEMDRRYWERVMFLNTSTDARLLSYLGVEKGLWPMDSENTSDLDKFMVRVTARKKFYETAIHTLQRLSCEFNPSSKLSILAETFSEISACVSQFSSIGRAHIWSGDDLLPAFMYVVVRAQLQHLGAEIRLISDFCPQLSGSGQIDLMFTMLCASYVQICNEKSLP